MLSKCIHRLAIALLLPNIESRILNSPAFIRLKPMVPLRLSFSCFALAAIAVTGAAQTPPLLEEAVEKWNAGKEDLAFTQRVRTFTNDNKVKEERVERYDPSLPDERRWHLIEVNGKPPTDEQRERLESRKNRKARKEANKPLGDYFEFERAKTLSEENGLVRYDVPVRSDAAARLLDVEKIDVIFSVREATKTIEHVAAGLREPMRIALGLVRVTDIDLDIHFDASSEVIPPPPPPSNPPSTAHVAVSKLGDRLEYTWSDFKRVTTHRDRTEE
jgi:hypothetical protein